MSSSFDFSSLVELCRHTHDAVQSRVGRLADTSLAARNWLLGWYIVEYEQNGADRAAYGSGLLDRLSVALGKGFSVRSLRQFRAFYLHRKEIRQSASAETLPSLSALPSNMLGIRQTLSAELFKGFTLGWSHYVELLTIASPDERRFYEIEAAANQWSVRELQRQMASSLYERLALSRDKDEVRRLATEGQVVEKAADLIKNPLVLEFLGLSERPHYSEDDLESAIIDKLETFLLELGKGFLFEARQKRFTFDNDHFFVDLVFYNRLLRCYVLIDLKRTKLTHQDLGQMQMYVNYFDRHVKQTDELPTIGIVLCHRKNDALVELTLPKDANIFASKYQLYLPSKEELKASLEQITNELEQGDTP
jgi:predicted nuclease of restriction endonuclease-like (RecB) superfamily